MRLIKIAAALIARRNGDVLLVRKSGTEIFMQPGGKIEPGETPEAALVRELQEEIGLVVEQDALQPIGAFEAPAANEPHHRVQADLFLITIDDPKISAGGEIEEIAWVSPAAPGTLPMAPLTADHILPFWQKWRNTA